MWSAIDHLDKPTISLTLEKAIGTLLHDEVLNVVMNKGTESILHATIMSECIMKRFLSSILHAIILNQ